MTLPTLLVTGASGFIGRHLLSRLCERYTIHALARRSQARSGAPVHPNIRWIQADIGDWHQLKDAFDEIAANGGARTVVHLAAHYDFNSGESPEYHRTNVEGLRNTLDESHRIGVEEFIFSSSVAACAFPPRGEALDETSPTDGKHIYARTKSTGEAMLGIYRGSFKAVTVRFAALFSDWCEYPPMFMFLDTWLSRAWNRNVLGGHGRSAIPYLHVRDAVRCVDHVLARMPELDPLEVVIASTDRPVSHEELFLGATMLETGDSRRPRHIPKPLVRPGIVVRGLLGRLSGEVAFEQPWMADYVDEVMTVDASRSRERLQWEPRERLEILRRLPFMLANRRGYPEEWLRRNRAAMKATRLRPNLRVHALLRNHEEEIVERFTRALLAKSATGDLTSYAQVPERDHEWNHRLILHNLLGTIRTRERVILLEYCRQLARRRWEQGFLADELCGALEELDRICTEVLMEDPEAVDVLPYLQQYVSMNVRFACDEIQEAFESLGESGDVFSRPLNGVRGSVSEPPPP